jgi:hypothetical protein
MWWWMMRRRSLFHFQSLCALVAGALAEIASACPCAAGVVINEVYYDHPGRDDGWEFVEIHNPDSVSYPLSGWALEAIDGATGRARTVWAAGPGVRIGPGEFLCIAGVERVPSPGLILDGALENGPDAVRLVSPSGVADLVGYGPCESSDLYETSPAPDVPAGSSLARKPDGADTGRNAADFVPADPTPGRRNFLRFDIGVRFVDGDVLPCRGTFFTLKLGIANRGLDPVARRISIATEASSGGLVSSSGEIERAVNLAPGEVDSIELALAAPRAAGFEVRARLEGAHDEDPLDDSTVARLCASPGAVVVNEIMYRPAPEMSEWIEVANGSDVECNLAGWSICDATGSRRLVSTADIVVPPRGFAILANDSASFAREFPSCGARVSGVEGGWPALNDTDRGGRADVVALYDAAGVLAERVSYRDLLGAERGRSIERISTGCCSDRAGGIWHRCAAGPGATPGIENSTLVELAPGAGGLSVSPNPFSPRRDGEVSVTGRRAAGETGFLARIFDRDGYEIRRLFGECGGADLFSCRWDGRAGGGEAVRTGLYICLVEYLGPGGKICRREKTCVVVAGE